MPNTKWWKKFETKSNYKNWVEKRNVSEAEIAYLMGTHLNEDAFKLVEKIDQLLVDKDQEAVFSILNKAWKISKEKTQLLKTS